jgi:hypothetical protein
VSDAAVADPVAPEAPPFDASALVQELRQWVLTECSLGDSVRDDAYRCALSAIVHRVMKFGFEPTLNLLTARDALNCVLMAGGEGAEFFIRLAFVRALIEDDRAVVQRLLDTPFIPECRQFISNIMHGLTDGEDALAKAAAWIDTLQGEELSVACLVIGRHVPAVIDIEWLMQCPEANPRLGAEMALLLLRQERYETVVKAWVRARPKVRYAVDSDRWPTGI